MNTEANAIENRTPAAAAPAVSFAEALRFWLKLGFISFGGPAGQIAIMHRELVEQKRWISEQRFLHALNYCMLLPGPEAQQLATYIGWLMHRTWGGIVAGALFVLPSLAILIGLSWVYLVWGHTTVVAGLFDGIRPAVAALVLHAVWRIGSKTLKHPARTPLMWGIAMASFVALTVFDVGFPWIVATAALIGWAGSRAWPAQFAAGAAGQHGKGSAKAQAGAGNLRPIVIDDHTPTPSHARFSAARLAWVVGVGGLLWVLPMAALIIWSGLHSALAQMGWFFTKAALVTFGGAYAVLPYVVQGAVEHHQWLSAAQMMDGLALGETTPGPLIMIVAFVGFVGGWTQQVLGSDLIFVGAALAASVATWFTFLPSFVFILAGGPLVESTHGKLGFTAPLAAITAAVVGVIASLALLFLRHALWPQAAGQGADATTRWLMPDATGLLILIAAALALFRYKRGAIEVIAVCAAAGLGVRWVGL